MMAKSATLVVFLLGAAMFGLGSCLHAHEMSSLHVGRFGDIQNNALDLGHLAHNDFRKLLTFISEHVAVASNGQKVGESFRKSDVSLLGFSFTNCDQPANEQVVPSNVKLSPDPLKLPGNITASGSVQIKKNVTAPVKIALTVWKKLFGAWVEVPCIDNVGSCTYDDVCSMIKVKTCPAVLTKIGLGCKCPFPAGNFVVPSANLYVDAKVPVSGGLKVKAVATQGSQTVTCAEVELNLA